MTRTSKKDFSVKIDEALSHLISDRALDPDGYVPVVFRCVPNHLDDVAAQVVALKGSVRHHLNLINAIATWLPMNAVATMVGNDLVVAANLDQKSQVA